MNIAYISDDKYSMVLGVSLTSLYENNKDVSELNVYVIDTGISPDNKERINMTANRYNRDVVFVKADDCNVLKVENTDCHKRWGISVFYRFYLNTLLGEYLNDKRILYLDCDTLVLESLEKLWLTITENDVCCAVMECMGNLHKRKIQLEPSAPYFNSGVILFNLDKWKLENGEKKISDFVSSVDISRLEYPDEWAFNFFFSSKTKVLNPRYNLTTIKCIFSYKELIRYRKSTRMYSESDYINAICKPAIIHFTSSFLTHRPWLRGKGFEHRFEGLFNEYWNKSLWSSELLESEKVSMSNYLMRACVSINRSFGISLAGMIYCYLKPLRYIDVNISNEQ